MSPDWLHGGARRSLPFSRGSHWPSLAVQSPAIGRNIPPLSPQVSAAGLSFLVPRSMFHREPQPQVPCAYCSSPRPGPNTDGCCGRCGVLSSSGRSCSLWGGWGLAGACPNWGDRAPQGKLPMTLGPWPLWDQDEEHLETGSTGAEVVAEVEFEAKMEREIDEPPE